MALPETGEYRFSKAGCYPDKKEIFDSAKSVSRKFTESRFEGILQRKGLYKSCITREE
jgi:hypothetical protein